MKRDSASLLKEAAEADSDAQLRRRLQREADADERAERIREATAAQLAKYGEYITNWNSEGILIGTDSSITEPNPVPVGACFSSLPPLPCPLPTRDLTSL
jgi:hypothetical protein